MKIKRLFQTALTAFFMLILIVPLQAGWAPWNSPQPAQRSFTDEMQIHPMAFTVDYNLASAINVQNNHAAVAAPALLYSNGPYYNESGTPNLSIVEPPNTTLGNNADKNFFTIANEFILTGDAQINLIDFYLYQTNVDPPSISEIYVRIWDDNPSISGSVIWGDLTTNVLSSVVYSGANRVSSSSQANEARKIQKVTASISGLTLPAGSYWVEFNASTTNGGTPWAPPVSISGATDVGNALMYSIADDEWIVVEDGGSGYLLGHPFEIIGTYETLDPCTSPDMDVSIVDNNGDPIAGCISADDEFWVEVSLSGGSGNATYTVSDSSDSKTMASGDTETFGPYNQGTNPAFTATGDDDSDCSASENVTSPNACSSGDSCDWRIRVWANNNGEGVSWYLKDQNGTVVSGTGTAGPFNFVSQVYPLEGPVTFYLNGNDPADPGAYRSVNYYVLRDGAKIYHGRARNDVVHIKNITCDNLPEPETTEEACNWTIRVWSSKNGTDTSWSIENESYQVLAGESNRPATYNDIRTFNAAGPLTFKLNTDLGSYRSVNYNIINPRGKIKSGTVRYEDLVITDLTCEDPDSSAKPNSGASLTDFKFSYHPNPVKDVLYIDSALDVKEVKVFNMAGQQMLQFEKGLSEINELDVTKLPTGIYVFRAILEGNHVETFKVVKK